MRGRESEAGSAQTTLTLIQLTRTSRHHPPTVPQEVLWRRGNGEAAGVETLEAVAGNLHIGGSLPSGRSSLTQASSGVGSSVGDRAALFRNTLLAS